MNYIQIHWTCGNLDEARKIARLLVEKKLVACANIIPVVESIFMWNNRIDTIQETKVIFKTCNEYFEEIKNIILSNAKYEIPEILKVPISGGNSEYLNWVAQTTLKSKE